MTIIKKLKVLVQGMAFAGMLAFAGSASAVSLLGQEPSPGVIVSAGGLEWVWAGPCAPESPSCGVAQLHHDFHIPTAAEWLASFVNLADIIDSFILPTGAQLCASPWFNTAYDHCDSNDLNIGAIWHLPASYGGQYTDDPAAEAFLVRGAQVPEPGTLGLLSLALIGLGALRRKVR